MKLFKKLRKGFTLIELVVVIAVIAILSAISVVSYIAITNNAKKSKDQQLVDQVNLSLQAAEITKAPATMHEALEIVEQDGYKPANFKAEYKEHEFAYNISKNRFVLFKDGSVTYPKDMGPEKGNWEIWKFADAAGEFSDGFSHYLRPDATGTSVTADAGFDVGYNTGITSISYSTNAEQDVVIRTNSQITDVTVTAQNSEVKHYGVAKTVDIKAVKMGTYEEYGCVSALKLEKGKVEIEKGAIVAKLDLTNADSSILVANVTNSGTVFNVDLGSSGSSISVPVKSPTDLLEIGSAEALMNIASAHNQGLLPGALNLKITNDIDLTGRTWIPFGNSYDPVDVDFNLAFKGKIDGAGHTIKGLADDKYVGGKTFSVVASGDSSASPFGLITYACGEITIKNLTIEVEIEGAWKGASAFIAVYDDQFSAANSATNTVKFENCVAKGKITAKEKAAGFIGTSYISADASHGYARNKGPKVTFVGCTNYASVIGTDTAHCRIGGFVGTLQADDNTSSIHEPSSFTNCVNKGVISGQKAKTSGEFVGVTGSGYNQTISFSNCSALSSKFIGCLYYNNASETIVNPTVKDNVTIDLSMGY